MHFICEHNYAIGIRITQIDKKKVGERATRGERADI